MSAGARWAVLQAQRSHDCECDLLHLWARVPIKTKFRNTNLRIAESVGSWSVLLKVVSYSAIQHSRTLPVICGAARFGGRCRIPSVWQYSARLTPAFFPIIVVDAACQPQVAGHSYSYDVATLAIDPGAVDEVSRETYDHSSRIRPSAVL